MCHSGFSIACLFGFSLYIYLSLSYEDDLLTINVWFSSQNPVYIFGNFIKNVGYCNLWVNYQEKVEFATNIAKFMYFIGLWILKIFMTKP